MSDTFTDLLHPSLDGAIELDRRMMFGAFGEVALYWSPGRESQSLTVEVECCAGETFRLYADTGTDALDMFAHPFAYRTLSSIVRDATPEPVEDAETLAAFDQDEDENDEDDTTERGHPSGARW